MPTKSYQPDSVQRALKKQRPFWMGLHQKMDEQSKRDLWPFMGFTPHPLQELVLLDTHRHKMLSCGRRWGKSKSAGSAALEIAALGGWVLVVAPTNELADIIFEDCAMMAEGTDYQSILNGVPRMSPGRQRLETQIGGRIIAKSSENPIGLLGKGVDLVIFDEASKEKSPLVWDQYLSPTLSDRLGASIIISTPTGNDWFKDRWDLGNPLNPDRDDEIMSWQYESRQNPWFPISDWFKQQQHLPTRIFDQEYRAAFLDDAGGVFRGYRQLATLQPLPGPLVGGGRYVIGVDLAQLEDWTVIIVIDAITREMVYMERFKEISSPLQRARIAAAARLWQAPVLIDGTGIGVPMLGELDAMGLPQGVQGFTLSPVSKSQIVHQLAMGIEMNEIKLLKDFTLIEELSSFQYSRSPGGTLRMEAPAGKHDDCVIALALAWEMVHRFGGVGLPVLVQDEQQIEAQTRIIQAPTGLKPVVDNGFDFGGAVGDRGRIRRR